MPWLSASRLTTPPCVGGNPHPQIRFLKEPTSLSGVSVSVGAPALPHTGAHSDRGTLSLTMTPGIPP